MAILLLLSVLAFGEVSNPQTGPPLRRRSHVTGEKAILLGQSHVEVLPEGPERWEEAT